MQIIDLKGLNYDFGSSDSTDTIGIVFKTSKECKGPYLGLIIPKFMIGYEFKNNDKPLDKKIPITKKKCKNSSDIGNLTENTVTMKNYIIAHPLLNQNQSLPEYTIGDKVFVHIIDNDIKTLSFLPYSINRLGQRATDKTMFAVPANSKENVELTEDNTYFLKMDSTEKLVVLSTNAENGEICKHQIILNSKDGLVTITDGERVWEMSHKDDKIISKTSGSDIEQCGDQVSISGETLNIQMESLVRIECDTFEVVASTINEQADNTNHKFSSFILESDNGTFNIEKETHKCTRYGISAVTYHNDTPTIGMNGLVILPAFQIGTIPNIDIVPPAMTGGSSPKGSMLLKTDPMSVPLVKYPQLMSVLASIAAAADAFPSGLGSASAAVAALSSQLGTTKIMSS